MYNELQGWIRGSIFSNIVCQVFEKEVGRRQADCLVKRAFMLEPETSIDYAHEEGYRWEELLIYGELNYVGVYYRKCWDVAPVTAGVDEDAPLIYKAGHTDWEILAYHDSCWRSDGVENYFRTRGSRFTSLRTIGGWFKVIALSKEQEAELLAARSKHEIEKESQNKP